MNTVTPTPDDRPWSQIAAELRRIAIDLDTLTWQPGPGSLTIYLQPHRSNTDDEVTKAAVDAVAMALYGKPGEYMEMSRGGYHYVRYGQRGPINLKIFQSVKPPPDGRDTELARLRAEVAELRARDVDAAKFSDDGWVRAAAQAYEKGDEYGREPDNGDPAAPVPAGVEGGPMGDGPSRADIHTTHPHESGTGR